MALQQALRAIAEPRRLRILQVIGDSELSAGEVASGFDVTRAAISQHLQVLAAAGLVTVRREGTRRLYRTRPEAIAEIRDFLDEYWTGRLTDLKAEAESEERRRSDDDPA